MPTIQYRNSKGERRPGYSTIANNIGWKTQALMAWAARETAEGRDYKESRQGAADAGTLAHYLIECHIKDKEPVIEPELEPFRDLAETCYLNFLEWEQAVRFKAYKTEVHLFSEKYQVGGTPDCIAWVNKKLALFDWKSSNGLYPDMLIQCQFYKTAWEEVNPDEPLNGGIHLLRIDKENAAYHFHHWDNIPVCLEAFEAALTLHRNKKLIEKLM